MQHHPSTGNLAIRPCAICCVLVLHEEGVRTPAPKGASSRRDDRWRAFPHNAPGGASCIGGGAVARELREASGRPEVYLSLPRDCEPA